MKQAQRAFEDRQHKLAQRLCSRLLELDPNHGDALNLMGLLAVEAGEPARAVSLLSRAVELNPGTASFQSNLGLVHGQLGDYEKALNLFERALETAPEQPEGLNNMGLALKELGRPVEAAQYLRRALEAREDYPEAHSNLALVLSELGRFDAATKHARRALALRPDYPKARQTLKRIHLSQVPLWHFPMMNDAARNDAFDQAIRSIVGPEDLVLDIGTGAGLLAMMAARAGARKVISCEMVPLIAGKASQIIEGNGLNEKIEVVARKSNTLKVGEDLPERASILITETFDAGLLGEGALDTIDDARKRLLTPTARIMPRGASITAMLVESEALHRKGYVAQAAGFDLSAFNEFRPDAFQQQFDVLPDARPLSDPFSVLSFDFENTSPDMNPASLEIGVTGSGLCHGVIFWYQLHLTDGLYVDTGPQQTDSHWKQMAQLFCPPRPVSRGVKLSMVASHDRSSIRFELMA